MRELIGMVPFPAASQGSSGCACPSVRAWLSPQQRRLLPENQPQQLRGHIGRWWPLGWQARGKGAGQPHLLPYWQLWQEVHSMPQVWVWFALISGLSGDTGRGAIRF